MKRANGNGSRPAGGLRPTPRRDLRFHGGRTLPHLQYYNLYLGRGADWNEDDRRQMDAALERAMTDRHLNNVLVQYFPAGQISAHFLGSRIDGEWLPASVNQAYAKQIVSERCGAGDIPGFESKTTIVNLILPHRVELRLDDPPADERRHARRSAEEKDSSLLGLGGYHGSVHFRANGHRTTAYYAISAYNAHGPRGDNGIVRFREPWKNNVCVMYHELCEARTDPDVDDVDATGDETKWGWTDRSGWEIGDFPMYEAGDHLAKVMVEVPLASGRGSVPVQLEYSNYVHGPEGPSPTPRPFAG